MTRAKNLIKAIDLLQALLLQNDEKDELQLEVEKFLVELGKNPIMIDMTEDEFFNEFNCVKNHLDDNASFDGKMFETYGAELQHIQELCKNDLMKRTVWTIIEVEGKMFYVSGFHYVNRFGYLVTEEPVKEGFEITIELDNELDELPKAKLVKEITVVDPDTTGEVKLTVYKSEQNGAMFAMDSSFLDQCYEDEIYPIISNPFETEGNLMLVEDSALTNFIENADLPQE